MQPISTQEFNESNKKYWCKKIGIQNYNWEIYYNGIYDDLVIVSEQNRERIFYPILLRWKDNNKYYSTVIKPIVKSIESGSFPFYYTSHQYDMEQMLEKAKEIIDFEKQ